MKLSRLISGLVIIIILLLSACKPTETTEISKPTEPSPPTQEQPPEPTAAITLTSEPVYTPTEAPPPTDTPLPTITPTSPPLGEEGNPIVWAIIPETDLEIFIPAVEEATNIMMERTGLVVETVILEEYLQLVNMICSGEAHIGALEAFSYLLAQERGCVSDVWTAERFGASIFQGQILVRHDSEISSIDGLAGATYCRRAPDSYTTWIVPSLMMRAVGIDPDIDLAEIIDTGDIPNIITGIYTGICEAGATYIDARIYAKDEYPDVLNVVTVLAQTVQIPNNGIIFSPNLPQDMEGDLEGVFWYLEIFDGGRVLRDLYAWEGIFERGDYLYDPLREVISAAGVEIEPLVP